MMELAASCLTKTKPLPHSIAIDVVRKIIESVSFVRVLSMILRMIAFTRPLRLLMIIYSDYWPMMKFGSF
jgi:hypothetical protein